MARNRIAAALAGALAYVGTVAAVLTLGRVVGAEPGLGWLLGAYLLGAVVALFAVRAVLRRPPP